NGPQPDELLSLRTGQAGPLARRLADAVLLRTHHPLQADVEGGHAAMDLGMGDEALLDPEDIERLHPVGSAAETLRPRHEVAPERRAETRGHRDLVSRLAGEGDAEEPRLHLHHADLPAGEEGKGRAVDRRLQHRIEKLA